MTSSLHDCPLSMLGVPLKRPAVVLASELGQTG